MAQMIPLYAGFDGLRFSIDTDITDDFLDALIEAKRRAEGCNNPVAITFNGLDLQVRKSGGGSAFSFTTGEYGAEFYVLDPRNKPKNNPGLKIDVRAALLRQGGIEAARAHTSECLDRFGLSVDGLAIRVSRIDFAVDIYAPQFEPDRKRILAPANTRSHELDVLPGKEHGVALRVGGVTVGAIANRQLAIYDKLRECLDKRKPAWPLTWNERLKDDGRPTIDFGEAGAGPVWRFEMRFGAKQLRRRWAISRWEEIEDKSGAALIEATKKMRYVEQVSSDRSRGRWPTHPIWNVVQQEIKKYFEGKQTDIEPELVKEVNAEALLETIDMQLLGLMATRAVIRNASPERFAAFIFSTANDLTRANRTHPLSARERIERAASRYAFR